MKSLILFSTVLTLTFFVAFISTGIAEQPIVYYQFDELDDVVSDASGNGNDGTIKGGIELSNDGKIGKSFQFNGTDAYVELERVVQDNFTLMAWIKADEPGIQANNEAYGGSGLIWSDVSGVADDFVLAVLGKKLSFFIGDANPSITSAKDVVTGSWVHVAAVRDASGGEIALYIDGEQDVAAPGYDASVDDNPIIDIGSNVLDSRYYKGLIDEVKIFDVALTGDEIQQASSPAPVESTGKLAVTWAKIKKCDVN